jgi:HEAT repeat protein
MHHPLLRVLVVVGALAPGLPSAARAQGAFLGKPLQQWVADLSSDQAAVRRSAAFAVGKIGAEAGPAVGHLAGCLTKDPDAGVRDAAAAALGDIAAALGGGEKLWQDVGAALESALEKDPDSRARRSAAYAIGSFGADALTAAPRLRRALQDQSAAVRQNAAWALGRLGKGVDEDAVADLCGLLSDKDVLVRRDAAGAFRELGKSAARVGVPRLIKLVADEKDEVVLRTALDSLIYLAGPESRDSAPVLYPLLLGRDPETARSAGFVLGNMGGEPATRAVPVLRKALADEDPEVRSKAAAALANIGPGAAAAVPDLARALSSDRDEVVRRNAALALGHINKESKSTTPAVENALSALVRALSRSEPVPVRRFAAESIAEITYPANEKAIPALLQALKTDTDYWVRKQCVISMFRITRSLDASQELKRLGADRVLAQVLDETSPQMADVRYDAARLLAFAMGERAPGRTADVLLEMLNDKTLLIYKGREARVEGGATEVSRGRAEVKTKSGSDARYLAAEALGLLGTKAGARRDVIRALTAATHDPDAKLREVAKDALKNIPGQ